MRQMWAIPIVSAIVGVALFAWGWVKSADSVATPAFAWLAFAVLEYLIESRVLCDDDCNIRIELLLVPVLLIWTIRAIARETGSDRDAA